MAKFNIKPRMVPYELPRLIEDFRFARQRYFDEYDRMSKERRYALSPSDRHRDNFYRPQFEAARELMFAALGATGPVYHDGKRWSISDRIPKDILDEECDSADGLRLADGTVVEIRSPINGHARLQG